MLGDIAYAMAPGQGQGGQQSPVSFFVFMALLFAVFYFILIRPQQKRQKDHRQLLEKLKKGDRVVTTGGIHGTVVGLSDTAVTVEIADKVKVKVDRNCIIGLSKSE
ncbi:MAG: preprotein translocase subunit YajC [Deltaproteobacteria bacterium RBG_13_52_11]|nr:MAG: preprotein translocase subunit YajC [Deltaproteobacteria bacterium RBG_13_52_11]